MDKFKKAIEQLNKPIAKEITIPAVKPEKEIEPKAETEVATETAEDIQAEETAVVMEEAKAEETAAVMEETKTEEASVVLEASESTDREEFEKELENEYLASNPESKAVLKKRRKQEKAEHKKAEKQNKAEAKKQKKISKIKKSKEPQETEKEPRARNKWTTVIAIVIAVLVIFGCLTNYNLNNQLKPVFYQVQSSKVVDNVRIVAISDMHLKEFGENNTRLVDKIASYHPDIIAIVGDMNIDDNPDYAPVINLCARLNEVAPLYYSLGNHEFEAMLFNDSQIYYDLKALGVKVLNNEKETIDVGLSTIDVIGLTQGPAQFHEHAEKFFDEAMEEDDNFKLVLTHYPENFQGVIEEYPIDLAISGHAHGGQVRLPYIGGLYSSDQGFLPKLCDGYHEIENSKLIITKGLGRSGIMPRVNNAPEITIIDVNWY